MIQIYFILLIFSSWEIEIQYENLTLNIDRKSLNGFLANKITLNPTNTELIYFGGKRTPISNVTSAPHPRTPQRFVKYTNFQTHENT